MTAGVHHWKQYRSDTLRVTSAFRTVPEVTLLHCARCCGKESDNCQKFSYHGEQQLCYLSPLLSAGQELDSSEVHFYKDGVDFEEMTTTGSSGSSNCKEHYSDLPAQDSCFRVFAENQNWQVAHDRCVADGAILLRMDNRDKRDTLLQALVQLGHNGTEFWLDAKDDVTEGVYTWADQPFHTQGAPVDASLFETGFSPSPDEDCVLLKTTMELTERHCDSRHFFLCEITTLFQE